MIRFGLGGILLVLVYSCTNNTRVPDDIIPKEEMQKIFWDMLQADRFANEFLPKRGDTTYDDTAVFKVYQTVFDVHNITREEFIKSYKFYLGRPDITRIMFDSIATQAQRRRAEVYQSKSKADSSSLRKQRLDSLKRDSLNRPKIDSLRKKILNR